MRTGTTEEILVGLARHAVEGTKAPAVGITVVDDDHKLLVVAGGYGFPSTTKSREAWTAGSITLGDLPGGDVLPACGVAITAQALDNLGVARQGEW